LAAKATVPLAGQVAAVGGYNLGVGGPGIIANGGASGTSDGGTGIVVTGGPATNGNFGNTGGTAIIATGGTSAASALGGGVAISGKNTSSSQTLELQNFAAASNNNFTEAQFNLNGKATFFTDTLGDTTATGTKHAAVPLQSGQMVAVTVMESPEVWFEDFGSGQLSGGITTISLDPKFTQIVNLSSGYHVFLTAKGDCKGLFVTGETNQGFEVRELSGGKSSVEFDYRIVAHRNGYEAERLPVAVMPVAAKLNPAGVVIYKKKK
jgi:hypothetical protein